MSLHLLNLKKKIKFDELYLDEELEYSNKGDEVPSPASSAGPDKVQTSRFSDAPADSESDDQSWL